MPWIPESPRYLLMVDNVDEATKVINRLHHPEEATVELAQMTRQVAIDRTLDSSWIHMFKKPSYRKRSLMGLVLASSTQMVGVLVISSEFYRTCLASDLKLTYVDYGPTIYKQLGFDADLQFIFQSATIMAGFFASPIAIWIVDRMPRNILLGSCELGCVTCLLIEAALDATMPEQHNIAGLRASVAMLFLFFMFFNGGVDCTVYPYLSEIFPTHLRVKGMSLAVAGICLTDLLWLMLAPTAFASIGWKYYLCFIIPAFVMAVCILLFFPDTWGVPLEEIAAIFGELTADKA
ncbi:Quinate transporter [Hyphodiscus hymeniophilus]|uniref:Quinate transporter n=1 Tax=Hyphodiscus hymeniophilus TaxID=353542 RepID=A0A9P6VGV5_9HELO|nr:Quinate transporter [Hyphodiscus hymeniophilus]